MSSSSTSTSTCQLLDQLEVRYPLPVINHATLFLQTGKIIDGLRDLFEYTYVPDETQPKVKRELILHGRYNNHRDLPRIEIYLWDRVKRKNVKKWPIAVMVYRGTQNLDNPICVFRALDSASESISDYILRGLKERFGVTIRRLRLWEPPVSGTDPTQINPNLPSVTGHGTVGSQPVVPLNPIDSVVPMPSIPAGSTQPVLGDLVTIADFDMRVFAMKHELKIGCVPDDDYSASCPPPTCGGNTDHCDSDDDDEEGAVYDEECIADVHKQLINFVDVLNHCAEAEIVAMEPTKMMIATQYCVEDIPSDLRTPGVVDGGIFTALFQPIFIKKQYDRHTLAYLYASVMQKLQASPSPSPEEVTKLNTQLNAITELLGVPDSNGNFVGGSVKDVEQLFIDMEDPSGEEHTEGEVVPGSSSCTLSASSTLPGSKVLTTGVPIEFPQKLAYAGTFEYQASINRFKLRRIKIYHTETDDLVRRKLFVLLHQILDWLMDGTNDTTLIADNRETTMMSS